MVKYPSEGGYQPGDTWDLYIGADKRIEEIAYHRGAPNPPHARDRRLYGLQEGRPAPDLNGSPRDGGRKALPDFAFGCVGEADGIRQMDRRAMNRRKGSFERLIAKAEAHRLIARGRCALSVSRATIQSTDT